ncbi:unnamed protein product, partial [Cyprideis torosa]
MDYLPAIEYETAPTPTAAVIWLHGLGADGNDFRPIVPELKLPAEPGIRFIFPHAPSIPVTPPTANKIMDYLPAIEYETAPTPTAAVIWLHGLGADGNDFRPIVPELKLPAEPGIRFIFPHAPSIPVTPSTANKIMDYLPAIEYETAPAPTAAVIWLHGLGADGNDFRPIVPELKLPAEPGIRFIFPHAPSIPVTVNNGYVMPAWYDILEMVIDRKVDAAQLNASAAKITALIDREIERGIASERIVIAGFSQGGAVAYQTALSY